MRVCVCVYLPLRVVAGWSETGYSGRGGVGGVPVGSARYVTTRGIPTTTTIAKIIFCVKCELRLLRKFLHFNSWFFFECSAFNVVH